MRTLACFLESRAVGAIGSPVVLPGVVVLALRVELSEAHGGVGLGCAFLHGKRQCGVRAYPGIDEHLAVVGQLVGQLQLCGVEDDKLSSALYAKATEQLLCLYLHHLLPEL